MLGCRTSLALSRPSISVPVAPRHPRSTALFLLSSLPLPACQPGYWLVRCHRQNAWGAFRSAEKTLRVLTGYAGGGVRESEGDIHAEDCTARRRQRWDRGAREGRFLVGNAAYRSLFAACLFRVRGPCLHRGPGCHVRQERTTGPGDLNARNIERAR